MPQRSEIPCQLVGGQGNKLPLLLKATQLHNPLPCVYPKGQVPPESARGRGREDSRHTPSHTYKPQANSTPAFHI